LNRLAGLQVAPGTSSLFIVLFNHERNDSGNSYHRENACNMPEKFNAIVPKSADVNFLLGHTDIYLIDQIMKGRYDKSHVCWMQVVAGDATCIGSLKTHRPFTELIIAKKP
jgi:hypothetical protein